MGARRPWSEACESNKAPILAALAGHLAGARRVLEIGSGTAQHAVHFAPALPHLTWLTSDLARHHAGIGAWLAHAPSPNLAPPLALDVNELPWPVADVDAVFSANTAHVMDWPTVRAMFRGVGALLPPGGVFALYGPFARGGHHTSPGNARFDASLRAAGTGMGIRDVHELRALAGEVDLTPVAEHALPANNRLLVYVRP